MPRDVKQPMTLEGDTLEPMRTLVSPQTMISSQEIKQKMDKNSSNIGSDSSETRSDELNIKPETRQLNKKNGSEHHDLSRKESDNHDNSETNNDSF